LQSERGNEKIAPTYHSIKISVIVILIVEVFFTLIYSLWLCLYPHIYQQTTGNGNDAVMTYDTTTHLDTYRNYGESL
jgi:Trk-type K+ transport system membrane component